MSLTSHGNKLPPGYRLHWFRIESVLGQGGFGITYLAHDTNLDKQVAVKEYLPIELAVREGDSSVRPFTEDRREQYRWGLTRFIEEARTLAALSHPNIVQVHSVFEENTTAYMVMAYEVGDGLDDLCKFARLGGESSLLAIAHSLIDALEHMHAVGFIHRDIKPANIVVRPDGSPVLLDFGSARLALGGETRTLTSVVSAGYAPYEQYQSDGGNQGPWTDLYGLGATLYAAINRGRGPLDAIVRGNARLEGLADPMQSAVSLGAGHYSPQLLEAIDAALSFRPADRPQTTAEFRALIPKQDSAGNAPDADDVRTVVRQTPAHAPSPPPILPSSPLRPPAPPPPPPLVEPIPLASPGSRRRGWRGVAAALILVAGLATLYVLSKPQVPSVAPLARSAGSEAKVRSATSGVPRASFDCSKAATSIEVVICSDHEIGSLDKAIASAYFRLRSTTDEAAFLKIRKAQREFNTDRSRRCDVPSDGIAGVDDISRRARQCLVKMMGQRLRDLEGEG